MELYDVVDVGTDPQCREDIIHNRLNQVTCRECDFSFRVDKNLLYKNLEEQHLILLIPADPLTYDQNEDEVHELLQNLCGMIPEGVDAPTFHLVHSRVELVEKLFMLEEELDERIIEYIKYTVHTNNLEKVNPAQKALLFNAVDSDVENLCFLVMDVESRQIEGMLNYERKAYNALNEMFDCDDHTPDLLEIFPGPYISARLLLLTEGGLNQPESS